MLELLTAACVLGPVIHHHTRTSLLELRSEWVQTPMAPFRQQQQKLGLEGEGSG